MCDREKRPVGGLIPCLSFLKRAVDIASVNSIMTGARRGECQCLCQRKERKTVATMPDISILCLSPLFQSCFSLALTHFNIILSTPPRLTPDDQLLNAPYVHRICNCLRSGFLRPCICQARFRISSPDLRVCTLEPACRPELPFLPSFLASNPSHRSLASTHGDVPLLPRCSSYCPVVRVRRDGCLTMVTRTHQSYFRRAPSCACQNDLSMSMIRSQGNGSV